MSILIDIVGGVLLAAAVYWVWTRPPDGSPDRRRCLGVDLEDLLVCVLCVWGVMMFLLAQHV